MLFNDVLLIGGVALVCLILVSLLFKEFKVIAFDPDFAGTQGWPVLALDLLLMMMIALTVVIGLPAVGVVLISALLITPAAAARFWTDRLGRMLVISGVMGLFIGAIGTLVSAKSALFLSDRFPLPAGAVIVLVAAAMFVVSLLFAPKRGVIARWKIQARFREKVEYQRLLREMYTATAAGTRPIAFDELLSRRSWSEDDLQETVRELRSEGMVKTEQHDRLTLTNKGLRQAAVVTRGYRLWKLYMMQQPELAGNFVDLDAESIDRIVAPETVARLESMLDQQGRLPLISQPGATS